MCEGQLSALIAIIFQFFIIGDGHEYAKMTLMINHKNDHVGLNVFVVGYAGILRADWLAFWFIVKT